ncbi:LysR family transcriptional regulator [uncultured Lactobacillus sp.]|uniref:LysR family transcriptional regulator n=1 Tax=uncultured Lactobacillus sp. TaxID=153152 RepID=UPI0025895FDE|nr:LysR family transcriptional regulator [uncultured Lactobacillus sp.]
MELRVLRYFLAVCQEKNISKAAESLHIAQPSLSTQMKDLERELGVTLFMRGHRQITLTEAGYYLRDRAQEMLDMEEQTLATIQKSQLVMGTLKIGAGQTPAMTRIAKIIDQIAQKQEGTHFKLYDGNADDIEEKINNGTLDFGVIMGDRPLNDFESLILPERNEFVAIFNEELPMAKKEKITPQDLIQYPLVISGQSFVKDKFRNWWENFYDQIDILATSNLAYNTSFIVSQGHSVQITYDYLYDKKFEHLISRPLSPKITDPNIVIWKKNRQMSNLGTLFLQKLRASLDEDN